MIGVNLTQLLNIAKLKKSSFNSSNCFMSSIICSGTTQLTDKESHLKNEVKWLHNQSNDKVSNFGAVLYHDSDNNSVNHDFKLKLNKNNHFTNPKHLQSIELINNPSYLNSISDYSDLSSSKILLACSIRSSEDNQPKWMPPYTHEDKIKGVCYSMILDGEIDNLDDLLHLDGFLDWLNINRPELLITDYSNSSEYFFLWLVKSVQDNRGDVLHGLYKGLFSLSCNKIGGQFNIFFSDGSGVFTYSNRESKAEQNRLVSYKITRNEHNIFNYTLRNYVNPADTDWIVTKPQKLYYFPTLGAIQSSYDLSSSPKNVEKIPKATFCVSLSSLIFSR